MSKLSKAIPVIMMVIAYIIIFKGMVTHPLLSMDNFPAHKIKKADTCLHHALVLIMSHHTLNKNQCSQLSNQVVKLEKIYDALTQCIGNQLNKQYGVWEAQPSMQTRDLMGSVKEFFCVLQKKSAFVRTEIGFLQAGNDVTEKRKSESFNVIRKLLWEIRGAQNMFFFSINSKKMFLNDRCNSDTEEYKNDAPRLMQLLRDIGSSYHYGLPNIIRTVASKKYVMGRVLNQYAENMNNIADISDVVCNQIPNQSHLMQIALEPTIKNMLDYLADDLQVVPKAVSKALKGFTYVPLIGRYVSKPMKRAHIVKICNLLKLAATKVSSTDRALYLDYTAQTFDTVEKIIAQNKLDMYAQWLKNNCKQRTTGWNACFDITGRIAPRLLRAIAQQMNYIGNTLQISPDILTRQFLDRLNVAYHSNGILTQYSGKKDDDYIRSLELCYCLNDAVPSVMYSQEQAYKIMQQAHSWCACLSDELKILQKKRDICANELCIEELQLSLGNTLKCMMYSLIDVSYYVQRLEQEKKIEGYKNLLLDYNNKLVEKKNDLQDAMTLFDQAQYWITYHLPCNSKSSQQQVLGSIIDFRGASNLLRPYVERQQAYHYDIADIIKKNCPQKAKKYIARIIKSHQKEYKNILAHYDNKKLIFASYTIDKKKLWRWWVHAHINKKLEKNRKLIDELQQERSHVAQENAIQDSKPERSWILSRISTVVRWFSKKRAVLIESKELDEIDDTIRNMIDHRKQRISAITAGMKYVPYMNNQEDIDKSMHLAYHVDSLFWFNMNPLQRPQAICS